MTITDSFFDGGNITIGTSAEKSKADFFAVGGFIGGMGGGKTNPNPDHTIENCGALQGKIYINVDGDVEVGGFTSQFSGDISKCFSLIDITVESKNSGRCNVGGLIGSLAGTNSSIEKCYATGTVSVVTESKNKDSLLQSDYHSESPSVGGLVGRLNATIKGTINDSYALGNVTLSDSGTFSPAAAGGLVGYNQGGLISNCFSVGTISAQSKNTQVFSGGIVGFSQGTIQKTVALGASVTARGPVTYTPLATNEDPSPSPESGRNVGRIYAANNGTNNYAIDTMKVGTGDYNPDPNVTVAGAIVSSDAGADTIHGESTLISSFISAAWWRTKLNFNPSVWDFSTPATYRGYPLLKGLSGQF